MPQVHMAAEHPITAERTLPLQPLGESTRNEVSLAKSPPQLTVAIAHSHSAVQHKTVYRPDQNHPLGPTAGRLLATAACSCMHQRPQCEAVWNTVQQPPGRKRANRGHTGSDSSVVKRRAAPASLYHSLATCPATAQGHGAFSVAA